jgi:transcriptional regulator with XRE-family HTH domain
MTFGYKLKSLRGARVVSQGALAEALEVDQAYLSRVENDMNGCLPSIPTIQKIVKALNLSQSESDELYLLANKLPPDVETMLITKPHLLNKLRKLK